MEQDVGVVDDRFHLLRVGDEVGGDVAAVELHALDVLDLGPDALRLLDGDDAVLADLLHDLADEVADGLVVAEMAATCGHLLAGLTGVAGLAQRVADQLGRLVDAALEGHRVGAGGDVLQALVDDRLGEHRGGGGAVTGDVVGLGGDLLGELGADVREGVVELDLLGDGDTVVGDRRRAALLVEDDVAALGAERHLDRVGEGVDAALQGASGVLVELQDLGHSDAPSDERGSPGRHGLRVCEHASPMTSGRRVQETTARMSRAERMRNSSPAYLTSVPPYLL